MELFESVAAILAVGGVGFGIGRHVTKSKMNQSQTRQQPEDIAIDEIRRKIIWFKEMKEDMNDKVNPQNNPSEEDKTVYPRVIEQLDIQIKTLERSLNHILDRQRISHD